MHKIYLKPIFDNNIEITPGAIEFGQFSVTIGEGIKQTAQSIGTKFNVPATAYIERFFTPEMENICQLDSTHSISFKKFIINLNNYLARLLYLSNIGRAYEYDYQLNNLSKKCLPFLDKVIIIGKSDLSLGSKILFLQQAYAIILRLLDDILEETNQMHAKGDIVFALIKEEEHLDRQFNDQLNSQSNSRRKFLAFLLAIAIISYAISMI